MKNHYSSNSTAALPLLSAAIAVLVYGNGGVNQSHGGWDNHGQGGGGGGENHGKGGGVNHGPWKNIVLYLKMVIIKLIPLGDSPVYVRIIHL